MSFYMAIIYNFIVIFIIIFFFFYFSSSNLLCEYYMLSIFTFKWDDSIQMAPQCH